MFAFSWGWGDWRVRYQYCLAIDSLCRCGAALCQLRIYAGASNSSTRLANLSGRLNIYSDQIAFVASGNQVLGLVDLGGAEFKLLLPAHGCVIH